MSTTCKHMKDPDEGKKLIIEKRAREVRAERDLKIKEGQWSWGIFIGMGIGACIAGEINAANLAILFGISSILLGQMNDRS